MRRILAVFAVMVTACCRTPPVNAPVEIVLADPPVRDIVCPEPVVQVVSDDIRSLMDERDNWTRLFASLACDRLAHMGCRFWSAHDECVDDYIKRDVKVSQCVAGATLNSDIEACGAQENCP